MFERLAPVTSDHKVLGSNPARGRIQLTTVGTPLHGPFMTHHLDRT